jgi:hypothetical protein
MQSLPRNPLECILELVGAGIPVAGQMWTADIERAGISFRIMRETIQAVFIVTLLAEFSALKSRSAAAPPFPTGSQGGAATLAGRVP